MAASLVTMEMNHVQGVPSCLRLVHPIDFLCCRMTPQGSAPMRDSGGLEKAKAGAKLSRLLGDHMLPYPPSGRGMDCHQE